MKRTEDILKEFFNAIDLELEKEDGSHLFDINLESTFSEDSELSTLIEEVKSDAGISKERFEFLKKKILSYLAEDKIDLELNFDLKIIGIKFASPTLEHAPMTPARSAFEFLKSKIAFYNAIYAEGEKSSDSTVTRVVIPEAVPLAAVAGARSVGDDNFDLILNAIRKSEIVELEKLCKESNLLEFVDSGSYMELSTSCIKDITVWFHYAICTRNVEILCYLSSKIANEIQRQQEKIEKRINFTSLRERIEIFEKYTLKEGSLILFELQRLKEFLHGASTIAIFALKYKLPESKKEEFRNVRGVLNSIQNREIDRFLALKDLCVQNLDVAYREKEKLVISDIIEWAIESGQASLKEFVFRIINESKDINGLLNLYENLFNIGEDVNREFLVAIAAKINQQLTKNAKSNISIPFYIKSQMMRIMCDSINFDLFPLPEKCDFPLLEEQEGKVAYLDKTIIERLLDKRDLMPDKAEQVDSLIIQTIKRGASVLGRSFSNSDMLLRIINTQNYSLIAEAIKSIKSGEFYNKGNTTLKRAFAIQAKKYLQDIPLSVVGSFPSLMSFAPKLFTAPLKIYNNIKIRLGMLYALKGGILAQGFIGNECWDKQFDSSICFAESSLLPSINLLKDICDKYTALLSVRILDYALSGAMSFEGLDSKGALYIYATPGEIAEELLKHSIDNPNEELSGYLIKKLYELNCEEKVTLLLRSALKDRNIKAISIILSNIDYLDIESKKERRELLDKAKDIVIENPDLVTKIGLLREITKSETLKKYTDALWASDEVPTVSAVIASSKKKDKRKEKSGGGTSAAVSVVQGVPTVSEASVPSKKKDKKSEKIITTDVVTVKAAIPATPHVAVAAEKYVKKPTKAQLGQQLKKKQKKKAKIIQTAWRKYVQKKETTKKDASNVITKALFEYTLKKRKLKNQSIDTHNSTKDIIIQEHKEFQNSDGYSLASLPMPIFPLAVKEFRGCTIMIDYKLLPFIENICSGKKFTPESIELLRMVGDLNQPISTVTFPYFNPNFDAYCSYLNIYTPLELSLIFGNPSAVKNLLELGADPRKVSSSVACKDLECCKIMDEALYKSWRAIPQTAAADYLPRRDASHLVAIKDSPSTIGY